MERKSPASSSISRRNFIALGGATLAAAAVPDSLGADGAAARAPTRTSRQVARVADALVCDTFGTVVDWRSSVIRDGEMLSRGKGFQVDWATFADRWRNGYGPAMGRVRTGELPWMTIDELHRMILDELIVEFGLTGLTEEEISDLNRVWHRLIPWPDSVPGLHRLKSQFVIAPLSNGNVSLLTNMAKNGGLPWDLILSAEFARSYKPDPVVYQMAADLLDLPTNRIMMVAAHKGDLRAAASLGFRTAFVARPLEYGPERDVDVSRDPAFDYWAADFLDLADQLGA